MSGKQNGTSLRALTEAEDGEVILPLSGRSFVSFSRDTFELLKRMSNIWKQISFAQTSLLFLYLSYNRARHARNTYILCKAAKCLPLLFILFFSIQVCAQKVSVRTNLLYWASSTPNVSLEWRLAPRYTLSATVGYNAFNFPNRTGSEGVATNPKLHHWLVMPETKYWFCRTFERHYIGFHALYGKYNAGGMKFPSFLSDGRYDGWGTGAGLSYGYQWALGKRWGLEASIGAGYIYLRYDKYACGACGKKAGSYRRHYFGPTKTAISIVYHIR